METFQFLGFGIDAWITIVTVLGVFAILMATKLRTDLVFLGAIGLLFVTGVLDAKEAFSGFSSTTVVVVGVMSVVVAGLTHTGVLHWIIKHVLGRPKDYKRALLRLMAPVAVLSPLLNTVTVVSVFVGVVKMWAKKLKMMPSRLLIPIAFASNMGGVCLILVIPQNLMAACSSGSRCPTGFGASTCSASPSTGALPSAQATRSTNTNGTFRTSGSTSQMVRTNRLTAVCASSARSSNNC
ncbi:MAG: hypothetical protein IJP44_15790 [Bacteroidales bacterium]|nr:hypothetical protein [Bacteroidales bacterium]